MATASRPPAAFASPSSPPAAASAEALAPFVGQAGFFMRYPSSWVRASDRPGGEKAETLTLVGNFRDIDTVSVRREPLATRPDFVAATTTRANRSDRPDGGVSDPDPDASSSDPSSLFSPARARAVADALTLPERAAVAANEDFGVVGGVENGRSGVMAFAFAGDDASAYSGPGASPGSSQPYFAYEYFTEVCRASVEEVAGGAKQCVGPRGDVLDTVRRRNFVVATESGGFVYVVKASALESRWGDVGGLLKEVAKSFRVPQEEGTSLR